MSDHYTVVRSESEMFDTVTFHCPAVKSYRSVTGAHSPMSTSVFAPELSFRTTRVHG